MIKCLLFDLDDTLLINDNKAFGEHYFAALTALMRPYIAPDVFIRAINDAVQAMYHNDGSQGTNADVFERVFFSTVDCSPDVIMPIFEHYYSHDFNRLQAYTQRDPDARRAVAWAFEHDLQVVIATQPFFPRAAVEARLRWADVAASEFDYALITSFETMSASKPNPLYFKFITSRLGLKPEDCCMIGDSLDTDMPAGAWGFRTFWVQRNAVIENNQVQVDGQGTLGNLISWLESGRADGDDDRHH